MFYAFTLQLEKGSTQVPVAGGLLRAIVSNGPYVVLALHVIEIVLFLWDGARSETVAKPGRGAVPEPHP